MDEEVLVARLSLVDDMSERLYHIATAGTDMSSRLEYAMSQASVAFDSVSSVAESSTSAIDELSRSINNVSSGNAVNAANDLSSAVSDFESSAVSAASGTDYWTSAIGNYDKSAMEATHTTEELIESGYKTVQAFFDEGESAQRCTDVVNRLTNETESAVTVHNNLLEAIEQQAELLESDTDITKISASATLELNEANREAIEAFRELGEAQRLVNDAAQIMEETANSETASLSDAKSALEQAEQASIRLSDAQERANRATDNLSKTIDNASKSIDDFSNKSEECGNKTTDALTAISDTVIAVKIAEWAKDAASAVYGLADAFSEAEKTVINATGATGNALKELDESMMSAFGTHHADLADTAGAIGEINTRMQLTGKSLTDMTGNFLDFADITSSDVVGSVQNVTKVMNKWNVEQSETVSVLDKLSYEAQVSGASVDSLESSLISGASTFQSFDMSLDTSIAFLGQLELQGINSGTAIMGLKTAVKNFSDDGLNAADALKKTVNEIANMKNEAEATSLAIDTFGSRAGVELANAIRNGAISVEMLNSDLSVAEGTLRRTADAGETLSEKWDKASNEISSAFTNVFQPVLDKTSSGLADLTSDIGKFLEENEDITAIISAAGVGLGTAALGISAVGVASLKSIPAIATFATAVQSALGPIGIAAGIATAISGGLLLTSNYLSDASIEVESYTGTLEECSKEIVDTQLAHEKAIALYNDEADAVKGLSDKLELLEAQYKKGGGTIADFAERIEKNQKALDDFSKGYKDEIASINSDEMSELAMIAQFEALSSKADKTNADLDLMSKYADHLNNEFHCDIVVDYDTKAITGFDPDLFISNVKTKAETNSREYASSVLSGEIESLMTDYQNAYKDFMERRNSFDFNEMIEDMEKRTTRNPFIPLLRDNTTPYNIAFDKQVNDAMATLDEYDKHITELYEDMGLSAEEAEKQMLDYTQILKDTTNYSSKLPEIPQTDPTLEKLAQNALLNGVSTPNFEIDENGLPVMRDNLVGVGTAAEETANKFQETWHTAMKDSVVSTEELLDLIENSPSEIQGILSDYSESVLNIAAAYDEVQNSVEQAFESQFSLFDIAETNVDATVEKLEQAQQSQLDYWQNYNQNVEALSQYTAEQLGMSQQAFESLMDYVKNGSPEAAGLIEDINKQIENGNITAVKEVGETMSKLAAERETAEENTSKWVFDLEEKMSKAYTVAETSVENINGLSATARAAGANIIDLYAKGIESKIDRATSAAQSVADAVQSVFNSININIPTISESGVGLGIEQNATGTTNSADVFIAGENGPELIVGKGGSTVFPTSETEKIINAVSGFESHDIIPKLYERNVNNYSDSIENAYNTVSNVFNNIAVTYSMNAFDKLADSLQSIFIPVIGKTVEIATQTAASIATSADNRENTIILPEHREPQSNTSRNSGANDTSEKHIVIDINGGGKIEVSGNADKETILEVLQDNLKPVLANIIRTEIYEEGEGSYDF